MRQDLPAARSAAAPRVVDFTRTSVDLRRTGPSDFVTPDVSTAQRAPDGVIAWDPGVEGLLGGLVIQDSPSGHAGERHLDGEELIVVLDGRLSVVLLDDAGGVAHTIPLEANQATLAPRGVWHRLVMDTPCRYLFMGGGRTELRQAR